MPWSAVTEGGQKECNYRRIVIYAMNVVVVVVAHGPRMFPIDLISSNSVRLLIDKPTSRPARTSRTKRGWKNGIELTSGGAADPHHKTTPTIAFTSTHTTRAELAPSIILKR